MTAITSLIEDFTGGAVGTAVTTANTIFTGDAAAGTGTAVFITDPLDTSLRMMELTVAANTAIKSLVWTATSSVWFRFDLEIGSNFADGNSVAILNGYVNPVIVSTEKFFDVRLAVATGGVTTLQLRDNSSTVATTPTLNTALKHRVYVNVQASATSGLTNRWLRMLVYSGGDNNTSPWDSGKVTLTQASPTIRHMRLGVLSNVTGVMRFGQLRGDDTTQPVPAASGTVSLAVDNPTPASGDTVTLTATTGGTGTLVFTQTAGSAVTLSGTGNTRTFIAPSGQTLSFQAAYGGATSSATVTVATAQTVTLAGSPLSPSSGATVTLSATPGGPTGTLAFVQVSGTAVTLSGSGNIRTFVAPAGQTLTFNATYGAATSNTVTVVVSNTSGISALQEDFTTAGVLGATVGVSNSIFDAATGTGAAVSIVDPFDSTLRMMDVTTNNTFVNRGMDFTAVSTLWFRFDLDIVTPFLVDAGTGTGSTIILSGYGTNAATAGEKFFDIRGTGDSRSLQLRDNTSIVATTPVLTAATKHRVYINLQCSVTSGITNRWLQMLIYSGGDNNTKTWDSGRQTLTYAGATIGHLKIGALANSVGQLRFGQLRGDSAVQPLPATTGSVTLAANSLTPAANSTVTLTATTAGSGVLAFQQTAGTTVTLAGTDTTRTFTAPAGQTLSFTATYGGGTSNVITTVVAAATGITVNLGADQQVDGGDVVTLAATVTGSGTFAWTQTAGATVTLGGLSTAATRTFVAPPALTIVSRTFQVSYGGQTDTIVIVTRPHLTWRKRGTVLVPIFIQRSTNVSAAPALVQDVTDTGTYTITDPTAIHEDTLDAGAYQIDKPALVPEDTADPGTYLTPGA